MAIDTKRSIWNSQVINFDSQTFVVDCLYGIGCLNSLKDPNQDAVAFCTGLKGKDIRAIRKEVDERCARLRVASAFIEGPAYKPSPEKVRKTMALSSIVDQGQLLKDQAMVEKKKSDAKGVGVESETSSNCNKAMTD